MVLSNKKLKQKLRTVKAEALVSKVSNGPERDSKNGSLGNPESIELAASRASRGSKTETKIVKERKKKKDSIVTRDR